MTTTVESLSEPDRYDLVIAPCGYETRSRRLAELDINAHSKFAVGYGNNETIAFNENRRLFKEAGFQFLALNEVEYRNWLTNRLESMAEQRLLVDISCLTRTRLANTVQSIISSPLSSVDFFYSLAEFSSPTGEEPQNEYLGPVSEFYSGWAGDYGKPIAVVSGLGYEHTRAMGLIEYLDPTDTWLFFPKSPLSDYDLEVHNANGVLISDVDESRVLKYDVMDAASLVRDLSSLIAALRITHRCVILPLGPKIFALGALLVGSAFRDVSIWRASAGKFAEPCDKRASDIQSIFRVRLQAPDDRKNLL